MIYSSKRWCAKTNDFAFAICKLPYDHKEPHYMIGKETKEAKDIMAEIALERFEM